MERKCLLLSRKPSLISEIAFPGGGAVNKSGLIDAVSATSSMAKRDAETAVNALVHIVSSEVRSGRRVVIAGFGSFNPTHRGARMGRNPQTGTPVKVPATRGMRFAASATLKDVLNGKAALAAPKTVPTRKPAKAGTATTQAAAARPTKVSTRTAVPTAGRATKKVVGRGPARKAGTRAPARKAARQSARKAVGRTPARKASKRSAKKAVRRA
ncbi:MAG: HU family DNA-binding protein [Acidimicrobiales bacterium]